MLKFILAVAVTVIVALWFYAATTEAHLQAARTQEQDQLLVKLERLHSPGTSTLVDEWRAKYPAPSAENLTELNVLAARISADPASAEKYTAAYKQKKIDDLPFRPVVGNPTPQPGLEGVAINNTEKRAVQ